MNERILIDFHAKNETDTYDFVNESVKYINQGDTILLYGDLGSGKTYITKLYGKLLGVNFEITSPSFSIINQYQGKFIINHIDFYRIENTNELMNLGLDDLLNRESINFIEWPQIIEHKINWDHFRIFIEFAKDNINGRYFKLIKVSNS